MNALIAPKTAARMQRVSAHGAVGVKNLDDANRLARLYQEGAAKIRLPASDVGPLEAVLINTAGGLTGGDRIGWTIEAAEGASMTVTTQACEKVYRSAEGEARALCSINVERNARIAWLPQETIVYNGSAFSRSLDVTLAEGAEALIMEATVFGRLAMGESVETARFRDRWRVRVKGRLVHGEDFAIGPQLKSALDRPAVAAGKYAVATLLLVASNAGDRLDAVRSVVGDAGGASAWSINGTGKLLARLVATDGYTLRQQLVPLVGLLNGRAGLPKIWSL